MTNRTNLNIKFIVAFVIGLINIVRCLELLATNDGKALPIVMWHGMGDSCCNNDTMGKIIRFVKDIDPELFIHSIQLEEKENLDRNAGFFGNINKQVDKVCKQLASIPALKGGFNAIGFSQGGLFLRAYTQRCNSPPVKVLITVGSPHGGISDIPGCSYQTDTVSCKFMRYLLDSGAYVYYVRDHVIQAQYIKDPWNIDTYMNYNIFLPDINNERKIKNHTYIENIKRLEKFVLVQFEEDTVLVPKQTSWFDFYQVSPDKKGLQLITLKNSTLYKEDWLGLKHLDQNNNLIFLTAPFKHMQFTKKYFKDVILPYVLPTKPVVQAYGRQHRFKPS